MNLLFIGDIVGKGGRAAVRTLTPDLRREFNCQFCIANGENMANGSGLNAKCIGDISGAVEVITSGDHVWDQKEFEKEIVTCSNVLRPANLGPQQPGSGWKVFRNPAGGEVAVINLQGSVFMRESAYSPFIVVEQILEQIPSTVKCIVVDFHAEATSEKIAMGYFLDGKVTAVLGTHTHVPTADGKVLPGGTAYLTDVGMTGADRSVLGRDVDAVVEKFVTGLPRRFAVVEFGIRMDFAVVSYEQDSGRATGIKNFSRMVD